MAKKGLWSWVTGFFSSSEPGKNSNTKDLRDINIPTNATLAPPAPKKTQLPGGIPSRRISDPDTVTYDKVIKNLGEEYRVVSRDFMVEVIDIIRRLSKFNPDISQVIHTTVSLANTGHKVFFDPGVSEEQVDKMRAHLNNKKWDWSSAVAGMDGLVNKFFAQILISGAHSAEWVPNATLDGIESVVLVKPDDIVFVLNKRNTRYEPYQRAHGYVLKNNVNNLIKLNANTYRYYALNGDTENPYGFPPYISVLERVAAQKDMLCNIDYVVDIVGLIGFLQFLLNKPDKIGQENDGAYDVRLQSLLTDAKARLMDGMKDGVVVGYKDDHEFEFTSAGSTNIEGLMKLFENNEQMIFSALKSDPTLAGRSYNTSETQITVIFMKMLSELRNIQNLVKHSLEFGYTLELRLAGFKFDYLRVQFNRSTIQDDYKYQQAEQLKIENVIKKLVLGVIDLAQAADELGYEKSALDSPLVPPEMLIGSKGADDESKEKSDRNKDKKASDKKTRKNNKPVPKDK